MVFFPEPAVTTRYHALGPKEAVEAEFRMFGGVLWKMFLGRLLCLRWICCQGQTRFFLGWIMTGMLTYSVRKHQHFGCLTWTARVMLLPLIFPGIVVAV
jgi:hypothetical protein